MLSIARALVLNPKLLILDEPSQGLAPLIVREVFRLVAQMSARLRMSSASCRSTKPRCPKRTTTTTTTKTNPT